MPVVECVRPQAHLGSREAAARRPRECSQQRQRRWGHRSRSARDIRCCWQANGLIRVFPLSLVARPAW